MARTIIISLLLVLLTYYCRSLKISCSWQGGVWCTVQCCHLPYSRVARLSMLEVTVREGVVVYRHCTR